MTDTTTTDTKKPAATFADLAALVQAAGLTRLTPVRYAIGGVLNAVFLAAGFTVLIAGPASWWQLGTAVGLAVCYTRTGLIGHDVAHGQVTHDRRWTALLGRVHGNLLLGFSYGWWVRHHHRHHSHPNHTELDPDILRRLVVFTPEQGQRRRGTLRWIIRHQGWLYGPLMLLDSVGLRLASIQALRRREVRLPMLEGGLMLTHLVVYVSVLLISLQPLQAVAFALVHQGLFGLFLGSLFAPNHKGMPVRDGREELPWLERQVLTSRNVRGGRLVDLWYGGLNYQIEHHLFPGMPRGHLPATARLVKAYCHEHGIPYHELPVFASYRAISRYLTTVSQGVFARD